MGKKKVEIEEIVKVKLVNVRPDPGQPRTIFDKDILVALGENIWKNGQDNPIVLKGNGKPVDLKNPVEPIEILHGQSRWEAHMLNDNLRKRGTILAVVRDCSDMTPSQVYMGQIRDNDARKQMGIMETILSFGRAIDLGATVDDLADALGRKKESIEQDLPLLKLPVSIQKAVEKGTLPKPVARLIATLSSDARMHKAFKHAMKGANTKRMIINVKHYMHQNAQLAMDEIFKEKDHKELQGAGKILKRLMGAVKTYADSANGNTGLMIKANKYQLERIDITVTALTRIAKQLADDCYAWRKQAGV